MGAVAFCIGGIATLYGTVFAGVAAHSRVYSDMCRLLGCFVAGDYATRVKFRQWFVVFLSTFPALLYLLFQSPARSICVIASCRRNSRPRGSRQCGSGSPRWW